MDFWPLAAGVVFFIYVQQIRNEEKQKTKAKNGNPQYATMPESYGGNSEGFACLKKRDIASVEPTVPENGISMSQIRTKGNQLYRIATSRVQHFVLNLSS